MCIFFWINLNKLVRVCTRVQCERVVTWIVTDTGTDTFATALSHFQRSLNAKSLLVGHKSERLQDFPLNLAFSNTPGS